MSLMYKKVRCPHCGGTHVNIQTINETKKAGCLTWLICLILALTVIGLIIVIPFFIRSNQTTSLAICQDCGTRWKI